MHPTSQPADGFASLGLAPAILDALQRAKLTVPTPIQAKAIPVALEGGDLIGIAQTGTGKTFAFSLPMLQRLQEQGGRGLILVPTRELAIQVDENIRKVDSLLRPSLRTAVLIGGMPIFRQVQALRQRPRIIVATPGRLNDHLNQGTVRLDDVKVVVLDEADRMLDMGFAPQIKRILDVVPTQRQTMLFSATMPEEIAALAATYQQSPRRVEVERAGTSASQVTQELLLVPQSAKIEILKEVLKEYQGTVLVFSRTKHGASKLSRHLQSAGHTAAEIHSNRSLAQRRQALDGFKSGRYRVLVATDIAARGIDVSGIALVVNYDLPDAAEDYVHRIGRTGRAGLSGHAISLATPEQQSDVRAIERLINRVLPLSPRSLAQFDPTAGRQRGRGQDRSGRQYDRSRQSQPQRPSRPQGSSGRRGRPVAASLPERASKFGQDGAFRSVREI